MKKLDIKFPELWIHESDGKLSKVLHVNVISDEIVYFTNQGLFVSTKFGCTKLSVDKESGKK